MISEPIERVADALTQGKPVLLTQGEGEGLRGELVLAARDLLPEHLAFMVEATNGVLRTVLPRAWHSHFATDASLVEAADIEACAAALGALADPGSPLAERGGVGVFDQLTPDGDRTDAAEASVRLLLRSGVAPVAVTGVPVSGVDGLPRRGEAVHALIREQGLPHVALSDVLAAPRAVDRPPVEVARSRMPTGHGVFRAHVFRAAEDDVEHVALVMGEPQGQDGVLTRLHSECLTGDIFGSLRCDCGEQLDRALAAVAEAGVGVVVYLRGHEGRGIGLGHKIKAYCLQDQGHDTVEANRMLGLPVDARRFDIGASMLATLGVRSVRLLSNNPLKVVELEGHGLPVVERIPLEVTPNPENRRYLATKRAKLGHRLEID